MYLLELKIYKVVNIKIINSFHSLTVQLLAYAADIDNISRNKNILKNAFRALEWSSKSIEIF